MRVHTEAMRSTPWEAAPNRRPVMAADGMVTSNHPAVSSAGMRVLAAGGNAADAAIAMAAMSWFVLPGQCGVGGDAFALVREPDGSVWSLGGSGFGPDGAGVDFYTSRGHTVLPLDGPLAVSVPGVIAALAALAAKSATRGLGELWADAIGAGIDGVPCSLKTRGDIASHQVALSRDPDSARTLMPGGRVPEVGQRLGNPALSKTLSRLAADPGDFYCGSLADQAVRFLHESGAPFSGEEWAECGRVEPEPSIEHQYRGCRLVETPLPTPGWMVLQQAGICDGWLQGLGWLEAEAVHVLASAAQVAFEHRRDRCSSDNDAWRDCLTPSALEIAREQIALGDVRRSMTGRPDGDTTSMVAVDGEGRAVSLIHSLAFTFGARVSLPGTGVLLNNRLGRGAYLEPGHPNELKARRRPLHTLNGWMMLSNSGELLHVGNTPGGDGQVQWNMQLISHLLDHGCDPQRAVDAPRFTVFPGSDADVLGHEPELRCEARLGEDVVERLRRRGHDVRVQPPWGADGGALIVSVDNERGCLQGAADSRQDGVALGV